MKAEGQTNRTLADLREGQNGYVSALRSEGLVRRRLLDLGFVPGARVETEFTSPAGDPTVYRIRGADIALRRSIAAQVDVATGPPANDSSRATQPEKCTNRRGCAMCNGVRAASEDVTTQAAEFEYVVALAGNPNTGKSTVFNALTGLRQHVGNWPGKTVARVHGRWRYRGTAFRVVDLPGTYSLLSTSTDEEIARDFVLFGAPDCTVVVVDATCLERNLNLVFQILEITDRVVVCVNLIDEAQRKGMRIDGEVLAQSLGVPVVKTAARSGDGLDELMQRILAVASGALHTAPARVSLDAELQSAVDELVPLIEEALPGLPNARWIALRLIDGGDQRLREEIEGGVLAELAGRIGTDSLPGRLSPEQSPSRPLGHGVR